MKLGIALSGGGVPGIAAHIGFMRTLYSNGIIPDVVVGTSAGGIVAGMLGAGMSIDDISVVWDRFAGRLWSLIPNEVFHAFELLRPTETPGMLDLYAVLMDVLPKDIADMPVSKWSPGFGAVATNLTKARPRLFAVTESLWNTASVLTATAAVPIVFSGVRAFNDELYCDGGLFDMAPIDFCRQLGADKVVAVKIGSPLRMQGPLSLESLASMLVATSLTYMQQQTNRVPADLNIAIRTTGSLIDFHDFNTDRAYGVSTASLYLPNIKTLTTGKEVQP